MIHDDERRLPMPPRTTTQRSDAPPPVTWLRDKWVSIRLNAPYVGMAETLSTGFLLFTQKSADGRVLTFAVADGITLTDEPYVANGPRNRNQLVNQVLLVLYDRGLVDSTYESL